MYSIWPYNPHSGCQNHPLKININVDTSSNTMILSDWLIQQWIRYCPTNKLNAMSIVTMKRVPLHIGPDWPWLFYPLTVNWNSTLMWISQVMVQDEFSNSDIINKDPCLW